MTHSNEERQTAEVDTRPVLLIDNYDSFVFNLARYIEELGFPAVVLRNNEVTVASALDLNPRAVVLSPGPCGPPEAGICVELVKAFPRRIPMLGVCLGHQCIAAAFGASVVRAREPIHGRSALIQHDGRGIWAGLPQPLQATRYHSLIVDAETLPAEFEVTATVDGIVMAMSHREFPLHGLQFHPESVLTQEGHRLIARSLQLPENSVGGIRKTEVLEIDGDGDDDDNLGLDGPLHW